MPLSQRRDCIAVTVMQMLARIESEKLMSEKTVSLKETFTLEPLWQCSGGS